MKKIDIKQDIQTKAIAHGVDVICRHNDGEPIPQLTDSEAYITISEFFQNATYSIKNGSSKNKLKIAHPKYFPLKMTENETCQFNKSTIIFTNDSLEARMVFDFPVLNKEFIIKAIRKGNSDKYICATISYNNEIMYSKN